MILLARLIALSGMAIGVTVAAAGFFAGSLPLLVGWGTVSLAFVLWFLTPSAGPSRFGTEHLPEDHPARRHFEEDDEPPDRS